MIEFLGFFYGLAKDAISYLKWSEEEKLVDREWLSKSGFDKQTKDQGIELRWTKPEKVATREIEGWEILFEIDKSKKVRRKITQRDGNVLMGRKE